MKFVWIRIDLFHHAERNGRATVVEDSVQRFDLQVGQLVKRLQTLPAQLLNPALGR